MRLSMGAGLACGLLQRGAEDAGEVADVLGDQEVVLHEALDVRQPGMLGVAEPLGDLALHVEGQPLLGRPVRKCRWQRTAQRKSSHLRNGQVSAR
jgi:hypothetical protein